MRRKTRTEAAALPTSGKRRNVIRRNSGKLFKFRSRATPRGRATTTKLLFAAAGFRRCLEVYVAGRENESGAGSSVRRVRTTVHYNKGPELEEAAERHRGAQGTGPRVCVPRLGCVCVYRCFWSFWPWYHGGVGFYCSHTSSRRGRWPEFFAPPLDQKVSLSLLSSSPPSSSSCLPPSPSPPQVWTRWSRVQMATSRSRTTEPPFLAWWTWNTRLRNSSSNSPNLKTTKSETELLELSVNFPKKSSFYLKIFSREKKIFK